MSEEDNIQTEMDSNDLGPSLTESSQLQLSAGANEGSSTSEFQIGQKSIYSEGVSGTTGKYECTVLS